MMQNQAMANTTVIMSQQSKANELGRENQRKLEKVKKLYNFVNWSFVTPLSLLLRIAWPTSRNKPPKLFRKMGFGVERDVACQTKSRE
ncbi:hypothetical protein V6N13_068463 [Hibiscus sabdariffa]